MDIYASKTCSFKAVQFLSSGYASGKAHCETGLTEE